MSRRTTGDQQTLPEVSRSEGWRREWLLRAFSSMARIREFELGVQRLFAANELPGFVHLSIGQEAVAAGACLALQVQDWITSTHRGHGHCIAKGADIAAMMAELFGRATGTCRGQGGSMHVADPGVGVLGANGIVAAGMPIAAGAAFAEKLRGHRNVALSFFGDGAVSQGLFHETMNLAALWKLPIVFVCENNGFSEFTTFAASSPVPSVAARAAAYDMPAVRVNGNDVEVVFRACEDAVTRARAGSGPTLIEAVTYRVRGHYEGDPAKYRATAEGDHADPLDLCARRLAELGTAADEVESRRAAARLEVERAVDSARNAPEPDLPGAFTTTYAGLAEEVPGSPRRDVPTRYRYMDAIGEALKEEIEADPEVLLIGIDVGAGGVYGVTRALAPHVGKQVFDVPISEAAALGLGVGLAVAGFRPVVEIMFMDFLGVAFDQLVNQAAKLRFMTGGKIRMPLVVRTQMGGGTNAGAQHSQSWEGLVAQIPGLRVVMAATARDAKGLLKAAIRSDDPVVFVENRQLYSKRESPPPDGEVLRIGAARLVRTGSQVTVVAWSRMVLECLEAAETLDREGISVEVIDLRTISPPDVTAVVNSVRRTGRLLVVHEAVRQFGPGAEIVASVQEAAFGCLKAPATRIGAPDCPSPFSPALESHYLPCSAAIATSIRELARRAR